MQEPEQQQSREECVPETAREAAVDFLRPYVVDGWTLKEISARPLRIDRQEYAARTGNGGTIGDEFGEPHTVKRSEVVVTRVGSIPCWTLLEVADLKAEIHDEQRGYSQLSLENQSSNGDRKSKSNRTQRRSG